jgi:hypothetical protein
MFMARGTADDGSIHESKNGEINFQFSELQTTVAWRADLAEWHAALRAGPGDYLMERANARKPRNEIVVKPLKTHDSAK